MPGSNHRARAGLQLEPWYLKLNPGGSVPLLVRTVDGVEAVVHGSAVDILRYVDKTLEARCFIILL